MYQGNTMSWAFVGAILIAAVACAAAGPLDLQDGDIIFHTSTSSQSKALQLAMNSPYSHMGIVFVEPLNQFHLAGFPLGFWFAQQGSIYVFIVLVLGYALWMRRLDREHGVE